MRKKIHVQEAEEIEIQFRDKTYVATFNMRAIGYMQELIQECGMENLSYEHFSGIALYAGLKVNHPEITQEESNAIVLSIRPSDMEEIVESYVRSVNGVDIKENEEKLKKTIAQILGAEAGR